jgi:hypothetical protein
VERSLGPWSIILPRRRLPSLAVLDRPKAETWNERRVRRQRSIAVIDPPPECELEYPLQAHVACDTCRSTPRVGSKRPRRRAHDDRDPGESRTEDLEKTRDRLSDKSKSGL